MTPRTVFKLIRRPNLPTAAADVLAGWLVALAFPLSMYGMLVDGDWRWVGVPLIAAVAGMCVYCAGMVDNDVRHAGKDTYLRKMRPIVTGECSINQAAFTRAAFLLAAVAAAASLNLIVPGALAFAVVGLVAGIYWTSALYNILARGHGLDGEYFPPSRLANAAGVVLLGLCRAMNVAIGMLALFALVAALQGDVALAWHEIFGQSLPWLLLASVFAYFIAVTGVSLAEDLGGGRKALAVMGVLFVAAIWCGPVLAWHAKVGFDAEGAGMLAAPAVMLLVLQTSLLLWRVHAAWQTPTPPMVGQVVRWGIITHPIGMGAWVCIAMAPDGYPVGLGIAALFLACLALGRLGKST